MNDVEKIMKDFLKKINRKFPQMNTNVMYDQWNIQGNERKLKWVIQWIEKILLELYVDKSIQEVYIRLHRFRSWYVIRISGHGNITLGMEQVLYQISGKNMIFISANKERFLITAAY